MPNEDLADRHDLEAFLKFLLSVRILRIAPERELSPRLHAQIFALTLRSGAILRILPQPD